jgi:hypothetical protein
MGRPTLGKTALSNAEKQKRYRLRQRGLLPEEEPSLPDKVKDMKATIRLLKWQAKENDARFTSFMIEMAAVMRASGDFDIDLGDIKSLGDLETLAERIEAFKARLAKSK